MFQVFNADMINEPIDYVTYIPEYMHAVIIMKNNLIGGENYTIHLNFTAQIQIELHGLYRSSYEDPNTGETK